MCIICIKNHGAKMPDDDTIRSMFAHNPHGAGFMYARNGRVEIRKGFMTLDAFMDALHNTLRIIGEDAALVMHFRITTAGGTCPENTHPFPLSANIADMKRTSTHADMGVAHNGIIRLQPRSADISDTQEYIASVLAPIAKLNPQFWKTQSTLDGIRDTINGSRLAIMLGDGTVVRIGTWVQDGDLFYSNDSFHAVDTRWSKPRTQAHTQHVYTSVRMPWEAHSRLFVKIMPLPLSDVYMDTDGCEWDGCMGVDRAGRLYEIDPEEGIAYEAETYLADAIRFDKNKAIYFEVA
jgi:hypothetical protein